MSVVAGRMRRTRSPERARGRAREGLLRRGWRGRGSRPRGNAPLARARHESDCPPPSSSGRSGERPGDSGASPGALGRACAPERGLRGPSPPLVLRPFPRARPSRAHPAACAEGDPGRPRGGRGARFRTVLNLEGSLPGFDGSVKRWRPGACLAGPQPQMGVSGSAFKWARARCSGAPGASRDPPEACPRAPRPVRTASRAGSAGRPGASRTPSMLHRNGPH